MGGISSASFDFVRHIKLGSLENAARGKIRFETYGRDDPLFKIRLKDDAERLPHCRRSASVKQMRGLPRYMILIDQQAHNVFGRSTSVVRYFLGVPSVSNESYQPGPHDTRGVFPSQAMYVKPGTSAISRQVFMELLTWCNRRKCIGFYGQFIMKPQGGFTISFTVRLSGRFINSL